MNDQKTTAPTMNALNRALLRTLTKSAEAADIIADRIEELCAENRASKLREAELAKALRKAEPWLRGMRDLMDHGEALECNREEQPVLAAFVREVQAALPHYALDESWRVIAKSTPGVSGLSALDFTRLRDWFADPQRKSAMLAFTAGPARDAAAAFESAGKPDADGKAIS